jgi:hypothetical protein
MAKHSLAHLLRFPQIATRLRLNLQKWHASTTVSPGMKERGRASGACWSKLFEIYVLSFDSEPKPCSRRAGWPHLIEMPATTQGPNLSVHKRTKTRVILEKIGNVH